MQQIRKETTTTTTKKKKKKRLPLFVLATIDREKNEREREGKSFFSFLFLFSLLSVWICVTTRIAASFAVNKTGLFFSSLCVLISSLDGYSSNSSSSSSFSCSFCRLIFLSVALLVRRRYLFPCFRLEKC